MDAGVDKAIQHIDDQVDQNEQGRKGEHDALHDRVVAREQGIDEELTHAWPAEDSFGEHRSAKQGPELMTDDSNDRQESVAQSVAVDDGALDQAFGASSQDVVGAPHFEPG